MDKYIDYYNDSKKVTYHEQTDISNIEGVIIRKVNKGAAQKSGFNKDDIIREINGLPVRNLKDFNEIMAQVKDHKVLRILLQRQNRAIFVAIRLD